MAKDSAGLFREVWIGKRPEGEGEITPFQAPMTALSATIGTGNIAGVATPIVLGGPGAVFWMWITARVGMATKYGEAVLAVRYREVDTLGNYVGGPMYYIRNGMGNRWLWIAAIPLGAWVKLDVLWRFADVMNGLMAVQNLIALAALSPIIFRITREYFG